MDWSHATPGRPRLGGRIDRGFDHFGGLNSAAAAELCSLIQTADVSQTWMRDGARTLTDWVSARMKVRHETAHQLVSVAIRLEHLPVLSDQLATGVFSLDQVDAISKMALRKPRKGSLKRRSALATQPLIEHPGERIRRNKTIDRSGIAGRPTSSGTSISRNSD